MILLLALACVAFDDVPLAPYSAGERSPLAHEGGKRSGYSPLLWEDTNLPAIAPALTLVEGRILAIEGFAYPEPGASLVNLGAFRAECMEEIPRRREPATALRAILEYGAGTEVHLNRVAPGVLIRTEASVLELFIACEMKGEAWRVTGKPSRPPAWIAWSEGGRVRIAPATGTLDLSRMDEAWLLAWWGGTVDFETPLRPAGGGPVRNIWPVYPAKSDLRVGRGVGEWPLLVVLEKRARQVACGAGGWTFDFDGPAGGVTVAPLHGRRWVPREQIARWKDGLPGPAVAQARAWTARLRALPVDVRETMDLAGGVPTLTERFVVEETRDEWGTKPRRWAPLPPMFAVARAQGFPIRPAGREITDWDWLHRLGPLAGVDDADEISYRIDIPQLRDYLEPRAPHTARSDRLDREVDRILAAGPLAAHQWPFGEMGSGLYSPTYFYQPAELVTTLCAVLPHLDEARAAKLRERLRRGPSPFEIAWRGDLRGGAARERYPLDAAPRKSIGGSHFTLQSLYAAWLYAEGAALPGERPGIWARAKEHLEAHFRRAAVEWDYTERLRFTVRHDASPHFTFLTHRVHPASESRYESMNSRLNGLIGYVRLALASGDEAAAARGTCHLARLLALRHAQVHFDQFLVERGVHEPEPLPAALRDPSRRQKSATLLRGHYAGPWLIWTYLWKENRPASDGREGDRIYRMHVNHPVWVGSPNGAGVASSREDVLDSSLVYLGLDLTPELGRFYRDYARDFVELNARRLALLAPTWWMADGPAFFHSEESVAAPEIAWASFLACAHILDWDGATLSRLVDVPQAKVGDLYYLQKLAASLRP